MPMPYTVDLEHLRQVILGKIVYKKCPCCDKNGTEYWNETGTVVGPTILPEWGDNYEKGTCENCHGLAYVIAMVNE